jgi:uncharacterized membrane protein YgdD (TMEM256/DUF423 family)
MPERHPIHPGAGGVRAPVLRIAAAFGLAGVVLGAFGAHGLRAVLEEHGTRAVWETAVFYQLVHAIALLALAAAHRASRWVAGLWVAGIIVFSGSLYLLAVTNAKWLGAITPLGGVAFLAGWALIVARGR